MVVAVRMLEQLPFQIKLSFHTCNSMIVCSNRGPLMATSRDCWFLLQTPALFGACICLCVSAASVVSCRVPSLLPAAVTPSSFVFETFGVSLRGVGSLACSRFSPVPGPWFRSRVAVAKLREAGRTAFRPILAQQLRITGARPAIFMYAGRVMLAEG